MLRRKNILLAGVPLLLSGALMVAPATAADNAMKANDTSKPVQNDSTGNNTMQKNSMDSTGMKDRATTGKAATKAQFKSGDKQDAQQLVDEAVGVVNQMKQDPQLKKLLAKAKGVYIVPEFGRGALIVGARGGAGVVLAHENGQWTDPAFYDFGAISVGAQAGGSGGAVAFLLMSQGAVDQFKSGNKITLNADSGISIINYSANAQASWGKGDIILWSDTEGAYAGAAISLTDLNWDDDSNRAYYGKKVDPSQVLAGKVSGPDASRLKDALPG